MAITEYTFSETISTTEWSLTTDTAGPDTQTDDGMVQVFVDLSALLAGDVFELAMYEKVASGATQRQVWTTRFAGAQGVPLWAGPANVVMHGWDYTLLKISGTDRSIEWSVRLIPIT